MTNEGSRQTMYDMALNLLNEGVLTAIIPTRTADGKQAGLYALTVDLETRPQMREWAKSTRKGDRAGMALGMVTCAVHACKDAGLELRRAP